MRLRFRLRSALVLLAIASAAMAYVAHRAKVRSDAVATIERLGGVVLYETNATSPDSALEPGWVQRLFGLDPVVAVLCPQAKMFRCARVGPNGNEMAIPIKVDVVHVTDDDIRKISSLRNLRELDFIGTDVQDASLHHLERLARLQDLVLGDVVSEQGVRRLRESLPFCEISN